MGSENAFASVVATPQGCSDMPRNMLETVGESRFWPSLWQRYSAAPSVALCRVPELEYASSLVVKGDVLDHCCGDGWFASLAWPGHTLAAGCDLNEHAVRAASEVRVYTRVDRCDVGKRLPYAEASFDVVFNNSGLEHVSDLDGALVEIARVTRRGGMFAFNVLNRRYFEWWPLDSVSLDAYRDWQPFYHALSLDEWEARLKSAGFSVEQVRGYFDKGAARVLALLDCEFSGYLMRQRKSALVSRYQYWGKMSEFLWRRRIGGLTWGTEPDSGAGYFITAVRT